MEFPEEVLVIILVRLPIKDISSFKRVCKSWFNLISDPYFTKYYARNSPYTTIFRVQSHNSDWTSKQSFSLLEFAGNGDYTTMALHFPPKLPEGFNCYVIDSCDCSVFFVHRRSYKDHGIHRVYMFNPVLGSCVQVTDDRIDESKLDGFLWFLKDYRVGFIPSNNTYKLVRFVQGFDRAEEAEILTVGLDKNWRNVDDPLLFYGPFFVDQAICFNGAYHWVSCYYDDRICTFDLLEEKCGAGIPIPHGWSRLSRETRVTILNDRLSVADQSDGCTMVIWTMKVYGVVESWSKVAELTLFSHPEKSLLCQEGFMPIVVLANGDIILSENTGKGICFYNLEENRLSWTERRKNSFFSTNYVNTYAPKFYAR